MGSDGESLSHANRKNYARQGHDMLGLVATA